MFYKTEMKILQEIDITILNVLTTKDDAVKDTV